MSASLEKETHLLSKKLRCPVCEGQTVADSDAPLAQDIRAYILKSLREKKSEAEIFSDLSTSYGPAIRVETSYEHPFLLLWLFPLLFAVLLILFLVRRKK